MMSTNQNDFEMIVVKRDGNRENVSFDKILTRVKKMGTMFPKCPLRVNYTDLAMKVIEQLYDGINTSEIDELTSQECATLATIHPDYGTLGSRIIISNHQKNTEESFSKVMTKLYEFKDIHGTHHPKISQKIYEIVQNRGDEIDDIIDHERDFLIDYFGFKTLERAYLMKYNGVILERPQHMWLRVSLGIHGDNIEKAKETYDLMSQKYFTHATPTLFNAGTPRPQLSSCYLLAMEDDSIRGIYNTLGDCAMISKWAGGIGLHIHNVRASGTHIRGTNGTSNGLVPMLRVFNNTARYVDQCVTPETIIYTTHGPKQISEVIVGETEIFNLKGGSEVVENVLEHPYEGEIYNIETTHSLFNLKITGEHPVYAIQYSTVKRSQPEWVEAKDLTTNSYIGFRIPSYFKDINSITEDDCYFYGLMIDSCISTNFSIKDTFIFEKNSKQLEFAENYLNNKYVKYTIKDIEEHPNKCMLSWNRSIEIPIKYSDLYNSNSKRINYRWLNLPNNKTKHIIKAILDTHIQEDDSYINIEKTNKLVLEDYKYLLLKHGILTEGTPLTYNKFQLNVPMTEEVINIIDTHSSQSIQPTWIKRDNFLFTPVKYIKKESYTGVLYDLQMKNEHNYMIHNGIVHNGGGKRNGSFAMYLEPWHADIFEFLELKKNHGDEEAKARDLFYALWIPDLFMKRVQENGNWTLMCPDKCPGLSDAYGDDFEELYSKYEMDGKGNQTVSARKLWFSILDSQIETGTPYMLYKDAVNKKTNQQNLGTIKSSNLCAEISEYSNHEETAVCNLSSIGLPMFIEDNPNVIELRNIEYDEDEPPAVVYTKSGCGYCVAAKLLLKMRNIPFKTILLDDESERLGFYERNGVTSMPQIFIQGNHIGGYTELDAFLRPAFNFQKLGEISKVITRNLNKIIDVNFYPTDKTRRSNLRHRPIGIGVQGLADVFAKMNLPFDCEESKKLNREIFETIYFFSLQSSMEISKERNDFIVEKILPYINFESKSFNYSLCSLGEITRLCDEIGFNEYDMEGVLKIHNDDISPSTTPYILNHYGAYSSFRGSPASKGVLQFDMWNAKPSTELDYNWDNLKELIQTNGIRNSLLIAPMPTASTSQILGNNECFEPFTSNLYTRGTNAGEFIIINKHLIQELVLLGLWNTELKNKIILHKGSVQSIPEIPKVIREKYKIAWEIQMKCLIDMARERGAFICQNQSMNLWMENPDYNRMTSMHFYGWKSGLKTGMYYLRTKAKAAAQQFTIDPSNPENVIVQNNGQEEEGCVMCSG
jgi:ribonucleotide reductase alpha subunit